MTWLLIGAASPVTIAIAESLLKLAAISMYIWLKSKQQLRNIGCIGCIATG